MGQLDDDIAKQPRHELRPVERQHFRVMAQRDRVRELVVGYAKLWIYYLGIGATAALSLAQLLKWWGGK